MNQNDGHLRNDVTQRNGSDSILLRELCKRLTLETGLEFYPRITQVEKDRLAVLQGDRVEKDTRILLRLNGAEEEIKLACFQPEEEAPGKLVSRLLSALGREIYADLLRESKQSEQAWTWEKLMATAMEQQWDEAVFAQKAAEYALPVLPTGFPVLISCQNWHSEIPTVVENLLPHRSVFWVHRQELFLFVRAERNETGDDKSGEFQVWGESLIQQIHNMLADELGVLASVFVGLPGDRGLWRGYQEVRRLLKLQERFFPGKAGLAGSNLGVVDLLGEAPPAVTQRYWRELLKRLTQELLGTLEAYFTHGLSISETARALFIHRNTLLYRLDRVAELTGYNPREFTAAVQLYLAIWLQRHDKF